MGADFSDEDIPQLTAIDAIRLRPSMYLGGDGNPRNKLLSEALCLSLAEAHCGCCQLIETRVKGRSAIVSNDGLGLSLKRDRDGSVQIERIFTIMSACRDQKTTANLGHELCELGIVVVNAMSETFVVDVHSEGTLSRLEFRDGVKVSPFHSVGPTERRGTEIRFTIAEQFAGDLEFDLVALEKEVRSRELDLSGTELVFKDLD